MGSNVEFQQVCSELKVRAESFLEERVSGASMSFDLGSNVVSLGGRPYDLGETAREQVAKLAGLKLTTLNTMYDLSEGDGADISATLTRLFRSECGDRAFLLRIISVPHTTTGGTVHAILDERFAPIDHAVAINALFESLPRDQSEPVVSTDDAPYSFNRLDGGGLEFRAVVPFNETKIAEVGDVVRMGLYLHNDDLREYAPTVRLMTHTLACTNGAVVGRPEDFGGQPMRRKVTAANRAETLATFRQDCQRAVAMFDRVVSRLNDVTAIQVGKPKTVLAAVLEEFRVADDDRAAVFNQFADLTGDEQPITQYDFVNRITRTAHVTRFEELGARVLALPLERLMTNGSRQARPRQRWRVLQFAE